MCRWLAYYGSPIRIEDILYKPEHSLIDQSLHSRLGAETTNGDGFGIGWYGARRHPGGLPQRRARLERPQPPGARPAHRGADRVRTHPGVVRDADPADELPSVPARPLAVDAQRAHPRVPHGQARPRPRYRPVALCVDRRLQRHGVFFNLALTFGLEDDPPAAVAAAVGFIEETGRAHGVEHPIQMTVATTNGERIWGFRYSSERDSRTLFYSTDVPTLRELHPEVEILGKVSDESRLIVSEPLRDLPGAWNEVPESSYGIVQEGQDELHPFFPQPPKRPTALTPARSSAKTSSASSFRSRACGWPRPAVPARSAALRRPAPRRSARNRPG